MTRRLRRLAGFSAVVLVAVIGVVLVACGGSDGSSAALDTASDEAAHVEDASAASDADGAAHTGADEAMVMPDDEAAHVEGDGHAADDHDAAEANAYLEVAPKDSLFLVQMGGIAFTPNTLEVNAGEVVEIAIQNTDPILHDFTIDKIDADVHISYLEGTGQHAHMEGGPERDVHFALTEPGSGVVHLKINEPGEYVFYCSVPGHREAGMEGTLIVS